MNLVYIPIEQMKEKNRTIADLERELRVVLIPLVKRVSEIELAMGEALASIKKLKAARKKK